MSAQGFTGDDFNATTTATLPASFPKGFRPFWIMKYELTCQQWCDFMNKLQPAQQAVHDTTANFNTERHGITRTAGRFTTPYPTRAVNWMNFNDMLAFADFAGLRPFSELEYEKAGRGPLPPVPDEYAWGASTKEIRQITGFVGVDGSGSETASPATANCQYNLTSGAYAGSAIVGPVRVGIFVATNPAGTRMQTGAGYFRVYELTGNVWERPVTIHSAAARTFDGRHGDGILDAAGLANEATWPVLSGGGAGYRGGNWFRGTAWGRLSSRAQATNNDLVGRTSHRGIRCARTAP
jgi:formylglycine-generating enzyme required for sulfatase activity